MSASNRVGIGSSSVSALWDSARTCETMRRCPSVTWWQSPIQDSNSQETLPPDMALHLSIQTPIR